MATRSEWGKEMVLLDLSHEQTWDVLLKQHGPRGKAYCCRILGDEHAAEDAFQTALVNLYESRERIVPKTSFVAYWFKILTNVCLNELTRTARRRRLHAKLPESSVPEASSTVLEQQERHVRILSALETLPAAQRISVIMRCCEGLSYADIAAALQVKEAHAAVLVYRAKRRLAECLKAEKE